MCVCKAEIDSRECACYCKRLVLLLRSEKLNTVLAVSQSVNL